MRELVTKATSSRGPPVTEAGLETVAALPIEPTSVSGRDRLYDLLDGVEDAASTSARSPSPQHFAWACKIPQYPRCSCGPTA